MTGLHQWGAVTLFHGLPSDRVHAIAQDADGTMWFGTEAGLAKFDGRRTQAVTDPALPGGRVLALQGDQDGSLWIGTDSGAARLAQGRFEQVNELSGKIINAIIAPERGHAIFATEQGMVYDCRIDPVGSAAEVEGVVRHEPADPGIKTKQLLSTPLQSAAVDQPGLLPLTSLTLFHKELLAGSSSRGILAIENGAAHPLELRPQSYFIRSLETDSQGALWVGSKSRKEESGFYKGPDAGRIVRGDTPTGAVTALRSGSHDDMWIGSDGRGVFHFTSSAPVVRFSFEGTLGGLRSDHVYAIFVDREEVVWFGTDRGVSRFDANAPRVETVGDNPESNFVRTLYQTAAGTVYCGTNRGLFLYDAKLKKWQAVVSLGRNIIYALSEDKSGRLLVGAASGFYVGAKPDREPGAADQSFGHIASASGAVDAAGSVRAITQFQGGIYIASFGRGLERLENGRARRVWPKEGTEAPEVLSLCADGERRLLVGTTKGLMVFDGRANVTAPGFDVLKDAAVRSIDQAGGGSIWVAGSRGVFLCEQDGNCQAAATGFDARSIVGRREANTREAWCATAGGGLLKILVDNTHGPMVSQLDVEQGLPSQNVFAVLQPSDVDDDLLIGTNRGVVRYRPGRVQPALLPTRIISKRVHQPDELRIGLKLEFPQNSLLLDVTATSSRTFPEQFQYAFLLTDNKDQVIKQKLSRDSQFTMEGLKPGKYKVTARAFTKDLVASAPLSFELNVAGAPFPWTSTALAVLLLLALLALLWAILERRRIARTSAALVVANRDLAGARLDLANEAERERRRIARDLHDQTLADLRRLLLITDNIPGGGAAAGVPGGGKTPFEPAAFRHEIESVSNEIRRICEDLSPSVLDNVGLAAALEWALGSAVAHLPPGKKFEYKVIADEEIEEQISLPPGERIQIYRIAQEIINNICRHSDAKQVRLELRLELQTMSPGALTMTIEDDGAFFSPEAGQIAGRGLANIRARAALIEADVVWARSAAGGTLFTLNKGNRT